MKTEPGRYYEGDERGLLRPAAAGVPDVVICRRLADYSWTFPRPAGAAVGPCAACHEPIAYNPNGPHQDRPRICLQCAGVTPTEPDGRP